MIFNPNIQCHTFSFCELYKKTNGVRDLCGRWLEVSITTVSLIFVTPVPRQKQIPKKYLTNYRIKAKCNCSKRDSSISKNRPWVVEKIKQATVCLVSLVSGYFSKLKIIFGLQTDEVTGILHHRHPAPMVSPVCTFSMYTWHTYGWNFSRRIVCMYLFSAKKIPPRHFPPYIHILS